jgi:hypothetical protein
MGKRGKKSTKGGGPITSTRSDSSVRVTLKKSMSRRDEDD